MARRNRTRPEGSLLPKSRHRHGAFTRVAALCSGALSPGSAPAPCRAQGQRWWFDAGDEWNRAHRVAERVDVVPRGRWSVGGSEVALGRSPRAGVTGLGPVRIVLQRSCQRGSQTCIADALTLTSGGGGVSC
jgi:hypothetical protein